MKLIKSLFLFLLITAFFFQCDKSATGPKAGSTYNMVLVPAGEFTMGTEDGSSDEQPEHTIYLDAFYIDLFEVTNFEYAEFLNAALKQGLIFADEYSASMSGFDLILLSEYDCRITFQGDRFVVESGQDDYPVVEVTWYGANAYAQYYEKRLPTEAEWERAARGADKRLYPWGNNTPTNYDCNFGQNLTGPTPVGYFSPNGESPHGCTDMAGNVWEWCADWYDPAYYRNSPASNPQGPAKGEYKVARGGSWFSNLLEIRTTSRSYGIYRAENGNTGFRCAKNP
ncbi:SUMF1/EgtB/PvdO family nonheme iron enzyme [candidate division KSB1 bacterium]|nr:SUMF1/EgtB/PvdO family nonheme iron enzyme [candidate division KSB1 bacterium]